MLQWISCFSLFKALELMHQPKDHKVSLRQNWDCSAILMQTLTFVLSNLSKLFTEVNFNLDERKF